MPSESPAIVIPVYQRLKSLSRLLDALKASDYEGKNVKLVISVEGGAERDVKAIAENLKWPFGEKVLEQQPEHLGLESHLLRCGRYSLELEEPVIILEDDLFVSPFFYKWALKALTFSKEDKKIGGVSLYSFARNFPFGSPFNSYNTGNVYYLQKVSTWGQMFTPSQWESFENWVQSDIDFRTIDHKAPPPIRQYPDDNWEKCYNYYLIDTDRYFLYPAWSYSTNFGELGTHVGRRLEENAFQVNLQVGEELPAMETLTNSLSVYDIFFEMLPSKIKQLYPALAAYELAIDLYGNKSLSEIDNPYVLSVKKAASPEIRFGRNLKPHELNIAYGVEGNDFFLAKKENFSENKFDQWRRQLRTHYYHYPDISLKKVLKMKVLEVLSRIFPRLIN